ncbi:MAG: carbamate kinase [Candidatus Thorarchaeota archaeon]|nr:MAG: carbamate kinase [Candidatus Thorarchaeota archaeon]RLI58200.1 MAG: carbamate kinase [Candidatus Thorarchaeota archaeon]
MVKKAVVAIGGNSLIKDKQHRTIPDQYAATAETCKHIAEMISEGWEVVITSGNGPQVGFILRRSELAEKELHPVPLDYCGADTQGAIGYMIQRAMYNEFHRRNIEKTAVSVVTQVRVSRDDPAFENPTKPIGSFMDEKTAKERADKEGWIVKEDSGRGWRRVVPSPIPKEIIELPAIKSLIETGNVVYAVGGGGIPVVADDEGNLEGVAAVIDKDRASSLLATGLNADVLIISTAVEQVYLNYGKENQEPIAKMDHIQAMNYIEEGHFAPGSMLPKIEACIEFIKNGGELAIITDPPNISRALRGETGTHIVPGFAVPPPPPRR